MKTQSAAKFSFSIQASQLKRIAMETVLRLAGNLKHHRAQVEELNCRKISSDTRMLTLASWYHANIAELWKKSGWEGCEERKTNFERLVFEHFVF